MCLWIWACVGRTFIPDIFLHHQHTNPTPATHKHTQTHTHTHKEPSETTTSVELVRQANVAWQSLKTPQKDHYKNTTATTPPHNHQNTTTKPPQKHHHKNTTTQHHHKTPPTPPPQNTTSKTPTVLLRTTKYCILLQFWAPGPHELTKGSLGDIPQFERPTRTKSREGCHGQPKNSRLPQFWTSDTSEVTKGLLGHLQNLRFTTVLSVLHERNHEKVAMVSRKIRVLPQFWASDTSKVTKGFLGPIQKFAFLPQFWAPNTSEVTNAERRATWKICVLPSFERPTSLEVTKGSRGEPRNLRFITVLSVQHVPKWRKGRSAGKKFAFYLSFEPPTRTKSREGCQIHRCDPCAPDRKRIYFNTFSDDFD